MTNRGPDLIGSTRKLTLTDERAAEALAVAEHSVRAYVATRDGLRQLRILRSELSLQADYAEWLVARLLNLTLSKSGVEKDVDAVDENGKKYQIKGRIVRSISATTSFDFRRRETDAFDYLVAVFFKPSLEVLGVVRVPGAVVFSTGLRRRLPSGFVGIAKLPPIPGSSGCSGVVIRYQRRLPLRARCKETDCYLSGERSLRVSET